MKTDQYKAGKGETEMAIWAEMSENFKALLGLRTRGSLKLGQAWRYPESYQ